MLLRRLLFPEEDGPDADSDQGAPDPNDDADFGYGAAAAQAAAGAGPLDPGSLDPLSSFIKELGELSSMSGPDISAVIADLPVPQHCFIEGMSVEDAVKAGHLPVSASSDEDHLRAFTRSERILQDFQRLKRMSARDLKGLIQDILKNPEFSTTVTTCTKGFNARLATETLRCLTCGRRAMASRM